ncbi:hypothetical protein G6F56_014310 [Rhizopus delemar]|nr:hypothetical protein G6F35_018473 [Rhizopus arrhizus]KAG1434446.1 hypothetical protein G6F56_014310 [Rhizopus delemar]
MAYRAGGEVRAQVQLIGEDGVALILEGRQAARNGVGCKVCRVDVSDVAGRTPIRTTHTGAHEGGARCR